MIIVMTGLPGSGKSTAVKQLVAEFLSNNLYTQAAVVSSDDFFTDDDGTYDFKLEARPVAHQMCWHKFNEYLGRFRAKDLIVVDNTNLTNDDRGRYMEAALQHGHAARLVHVKCPIEVCIARRDPSNPKNVHQIPAETLHEMAARFQAPRPEWDYHVVEGGHSAGTCHP
jgi:tRNA uridine 5-carbamoylmethylation protein Kti12